MSYLAFSRKWAGYLAAHTGLSRDGEIIITYAIEVLVINLINVCLTLLLGRLLGVLPVTAACLFTVLIFRHTAGGAHSQSPWRCAIVTILIFPALALAATCLSHLNRIYGDALSILAVLTALAAVIVLAPVDSPAAPVVSPARRKRLKLLSIIVTLLVAVVMAFLGLTGGEQALTYRNALLFSILWVTFILSKTGHRTMAFIDSLHLTERR